MLVTLHKSIILSWYNVQRCIQRITVSEHVKQRKAHELTLCLRHSEIPLNFFFTLGRITRIKFHSWLVNLSNTKNTCNKVKERHCYLQGVSWSGGKLWLGKEKSWANSVLAMTWWFEHPFQGSRLAIVILLVIVWFSVKDSK